MMAMLLTIRMNRIFILLTVECNGLDVLTMFESESVALFSLSFDCLSPISSNESPFSYIEGHS